MKFKITRRGRLVAAVTAVLVSTGAVAATAAIKAAPAPLPVGQYSNGHYVACVQTASPYAVKGHAGAESRTCPSGTRKLTLNIKGATGAKGSTGAKGATGAQGPAGARGEDGTDGTDGQDGTDAPAAVYGTAEVFIARGSNAATKWASASTSVGSPDGDNASNTFRATCSAAQAPCSISMKARSTKDGVKLYPRLLIQKSDINTGAPLGQCEYADGTANTGADKTLVLATGEQTVHLAVGNSLDCGAGQDGGTSNIVVSKIDVPAGYYDIALTAVFTS